MTQADIKQGKSEYHEAIVVGTGMNGLYQLHSFLDAGMDAITLDKNADVGGTWFNNRYPGCRFDSESYTYGFYFDKELKGKFYSFLDQLLIGLDKTQSLYIKPQCTHSTSLVLFL